MPVVQIESAVPAAPTHHGRGVRRALRRAWRECLVPIAARDTAALGPLRAVIRSALLSWDVPGQKSADIELALSELATNALVHTDGPVRVRLALRGGTIRLDVADTSPVVARSGQPDLDCDDPHGWGLAIVETLADRTAVSTDASRASKTVTAEFDLVPE